MANVISIRIEADGKAAIVETKKTTSEMTQELDRTGKSADSLNGSFSKIAIPAASILSVYALGNAVQSVAVASIKYMSQMETSNLGIASSFMVGGKYIDETTGKVLEGSASLQAAQRDAAQTTERLQVANMQTIATLDQLIQAYQVTLPIAMGKGFDRKKVEEFTVAVVQAAGAIGVPMNQLGQELRALLTGDSWQDARIGQVLGLRPDDISKLKGDADGLFSLLMGKLAAYKVAGVEAQKSWEGLASNAMDIALQAGGQAFLPLFEAVKYELTEITGSLVTIDEKTKKINWNPQFLEGVDSVKGGVNSIIAEVYRLNMLIDKAGGSMTSFGSKTLKTAEIITRFMTIGQFGDTFKKGSEEFAKWNKLYEERYLAADKALQALADREAGLGKTSPAGSSTYNQNAPAVDAAAAEKTRKAAEKARKAAETAARNARDIEMVLEASAERTLLIGQSTDAKALLQLDLTHKKERKSLVDHHASLAQLAQADANQQLERLTLLNEQKLKKMTELIESGQALAEAEGRAFSVVTGAGQDLSSGDRYKVTNLKDYRLRDNKRRSIAQAPPPELDPRAFNNLNNSMSQNLAGQGYDASRVALLQQLDERQQLIEEYRDKELVTVEERAALMLAADEEYAAQKTALDKATADKALASVSSSLTSIGQVMMQGNRDQFEAGKTMAIAGATIDTYRAATGAYAAMASIPYVGPVLGALAATAAVVSGTMQIAQIESTQYRGGRALGGPVESGSTYLVGERGPELLTMGGQGGTVTPNSALGGQRQSVRVTNVYQISTGVADTVRAEIMKAVPAITQHTVTAVGRAINSGGSLSAAVGRM